MWWQGVTLSYYCTSGHFPFKASSDWIFYAKIFVVNVTHLTINSVVCLTNVLKMCTLTVFVSLSIKNNALYNKIIKIKKIVMFCVFYCCNIVLYQITRWFSRSQIRSDTSMRHLHLLGSNAIIFIM